MNFDISPEVPKFELEQPFEWGEHENRITNSRRQMEKLGLTGLLLTSLHSLYYLFGYDKVATAGSIQAVFLPLRGEAVAVVRGVNLWLAQQSPFLQEVFIWNDTSGGAPQAIARAIAERQQLSSSRIGVELDHSSLTPKKSEAVSLALKAEGATLIDASTLVTALRVRKSPAEVAKMRRAGELLDITYEAAFAAMKPGTRECDIAGAALHAVYGAGGDFCIFPPLLSSGINTLICTHLPPTRRKLNAGDPVLMECGAAYQRYHVVGSHTVICGRAPSVEMSEHYRRAREVVEAGRAIIGPGVPTAEVARAMSSARRDETQQFRAGNQLGYSSGIGYNDVWYDHIGILPSDELILEVGMTFSLFGSFLNGRQYCMHSVDPVVITDSGFDDLTHLDRNDLRVVGS
jgi:Xaa-Pro dipeptidase